MTDMNDHGQASAGDIAPSLCKAHPLFIGQRKRFTGGAGDEHTGNARLIQQFSLLLDDLEPQHRMFIERRVDRGNQSLEADHLVIPSVPASRLGGAKMVRPSLDLPIPPVMRLTR
jgi:hypothetical protein